AIALEHFRMPQPLAVGGIVSVEHIAAEDNHLRSAVVTVQQRRRVRIGRLALGAGTALDEPLLLAGVLVVGDDVAFAAALGILDGNRDEGVTGQNRRIGVAPPDRVWAEASGEIDRPNALAGEIVTGQI